MCTVCTKNGRLEHIQRSAGYCLMCRREAGAWGRERKDGVAGRGETIMSMLGVGFYGEGNDEFAIRKITSDSWETDQWARSAI